MYFKVDRKVLKKALVFLKTKIKETEGAISQQEYNRMLENNEIKQDVFYRVYDGIIDTELYIKYIEQIEFALYKTKMDEFYIDYDFAKAIRPALLTKKVTKHD